MIAMSMRRGLMGGGEMPNEQPHFWWVVMGLRESGRDRGIFVCLCIHGDCV